MLEKVSHSTAKIIWPDILTRNCLCNVRDSIALRRILVYIDLLLSQ